MSAPREERPGAGRSRGAGWPFAQGGWWTTLDLATLAFVARFAVMIYALAEPVWDGHYYDFGARRIAGGHGYSEDLVIAGPGGVEQTIWHAWAHYPVGYPGLLAFFYKLLGRSLMVAPLVNALTGAALVAVVHRLALHAYAARDGSSSHSSSPSHSSHSSSGPMRALIAGLVVALHPGLVLYSGALMTEPLAALGMLAAVLVAVADRNALRAAAIAGVAVGLTTLVRPNAILLAPMVPIALAMSRPRAAFTPPRSLAVVARALGRFVAHGAITCALAVATVAPWTVRNCRVMDACAFVSTNAGWNLVIGSAPGATGKFEFLVGHTPEGGPTCDAGGQVEQDRCWWHYGADTIRRDPRRWLALVPAKLHYLLDEEWFPINYLREARPDVISAAAHLWWGRLLCHVHQLLLFCAAIAVVGRPSARRERPVRFTVQLLLFAAIVAIALAGSDAPIAVVWPLGVIACVLPMLPLPGAPPRRAAEIGAAAVVLATLVTHAIFFGEDRYHLVATPAYALLAAGLGRRMRLLAPRRGA